MFSNRVGTLRTGIKSFVAAFGTSPFPQAATTSLSTLCSTHLLLQSSNIGVAFYSICFLNRLGLHFVRIRKACSDSITARRADFHERVPSKNDELS